MGELHMKTSIKYPLPLKIAGLGGYLPKRIVESSEIEAKCSLEPGWYKRKQGIAERRWIIDESVSFMCGRAAEEAIKDAGIDIKDIDLILNASNSFDYAVPDQSIQVMSELKIHNSDVMCMSINCGCLSCLAALDIGASLLAMERYRNILVVSCMVSSPGINYNDPISCGMLGDAAAAMVLTRSADSDKSCLHAARMETYSQAAGVKGFTGKTKKKTLFSKDALFDDLNFEFDSKSMQAEGMKYNKNFMSKLFPVKRNQIKLIIPNQSTRIASDMMKLMFPSSRIMTVIDHFGNIGAAGHPMALYEAARNGVISRGDLILLHGMGAGFSIYGILLTY